MRFAASQTGRIVAVALYAGMLSMMVFLTGMFDLDGFARLAVIFLPIVITLLIFGNYIKRKYIQYSQHIGQFALPPVCLQAVRQQHPGLSLEQYIEIEQGLRQFFLTYLNSCFDFVAMPSKAVDTLWHEFILCTRDYEDFCQRAFGHFLHHQPAVAMDPAEKEMNEGLRRCWWHACKIEEIDPYNATRPPLLFELDASLNIANGFYYVIKPVAPLEISDLQRMKHTFTSVALAVLPIAVFADIKFDGTLAGFAPKKEGGDGDGGGCGGCGG